MSFSNVWIFSLLILSACKASYEAECIGKSRTDRELNMNVSSRRNETGGWISTFTAKKESISNFSAIDVDVTLKFSECQERQMVLIRGVLIESIQENSEERLIFHPNCGSNVVITNGGRSIAKIKETEERHGAAITNRPLKDNEIFEVRLDKKTSKIDFGVGIGVTTLDPKNLLIPMLMNELKQGTWMIYDANVHMNGTMIKKDYVRNLQTQEVGDRLGIRRTESGTLHLYINGIDQGPAVTGVPKNTYGVYELQGSAVGATMVDASYS